MPHNPRHTLRLIGTDSHFGQSSSQIFEKYETWTLYGCDVQKDGLKWQKTDKLASLHRGSPLVRGGGGAKATWTINLRLYPFLCSRADGIKANMSTEGQQYARALSDGCQHTVNLTTHLCTPGCFWLDTTVLDTSFMLHQLIGRTTLQRFCCCCHDKFPLPTVR